MKLAITAGAAVIGTKEIEMLEKNVTEVLADALARSIVNKVIESAVSETTGSIT